MVAALNEMCAPTSRKYVAEEGIVMPNWLKTFQTFRSHSSLFALESNLKSKFSELLPLIDPLLVTFSETCAPTSRKYVAEKGLMMPNLWQTRQSFWLHSSFFLLEKYTKNLNFQSFYTTKTRSNGEFQWELCTNFQKKCSSGRYNYVKFFQVTSIFLVAASALAFRKSFFTS